MSASWNKITQPDSSSAWSLIPDQQAAIKSMRVIIPVSGTVERGDGSTTGLAIVYGATLPVPTKVFRTDINAYETWDGTNWNPDVGSVIGFLDEVVARTGISTTDTLLSNAGAVSLIAGHTYLLQCKVNTASTSSGTNMALSIVFKKSVTSDNTVAGTQMHSFTIWTAPAGASGKDDTVSARYKATVTETVNFKITGYRVVGSDTWQSSSRNLAITDEGTRV